MAVVTPVQPPAPVQAVAAPTQAVKQARAPLNVRTETAEAVDAPEDSVELNATKREKQRGGKLDILV